MNPRARGGSRRKPPAWEGAVSVGMVISRAGLVQYAVDVDVIV